VVMSNIDPLRGILLICIGLYNTVPIGYAAKTVYAKRRKEPSPMGGGR
jgi:hypothetical protein